MMERPETRAVIIAQRRSGSTMLCYALSNHPEVHCTRGEPMHRLNSWRWAFGGKATPWGNQVYKQILGLALNQWGYRACVAKVNWLPGTEEVWDWLASKDPLIKAILLSRENHLRQAVSEIIRKETRWTDHPRVHTEEQLSVFTLTIPPGALLEVMGALEREKEFAREVVESRGILHMAVTYSELVGEEGEEIAFLEHKIKNDLCDWLGVWRVPVLWVDPLRRVNPYPLAQIIGNWPRVEEAVKASKWAWCLEDEARWN